MSLLASWCGVQTKLKVGRLVSSRTVVPNLLDGFGTTVSARRHIRQTLVRKVGKGRRTPPDKGTNLYAKYLWLTSTWVNVVPDLLLS